MQSIIQLKVWMIWAYVKNIYFVWQLKMPYLCHCSKVKVRFKFTKAGGNRTAEDTKKLMQVIGAKEEDTPLLKFWMQGLSLQYRQHILTASKSSRWYQTSIWVTVIAILQSPLRLFFCPLLLPVIVHLNTFTYFVKLNLNIYYLWRTSNERYN